MTVNRLLNQHHLNREQEMVDSLKIEAIQAKGMDVKYLIRELVNRDPLFGEATMSEFKEAVVIEMYLSDIQSFNGDGDIFAKFGMTFTDTATFEVSVSRFREELGKYGLERPREGDLIYVELDDALYEIKKVKRDPQFYALGRNYTQVLQCALFQFSHEKLPEQEDFDSFRDLTTVLDSGSAENNMAKTLGVGGDESEFFIDEAKNMTTFDPSNPFKE